MTGQPASRAPSPGEPLRELASLAARAGAARVAEEAARLAQRLGEGRFYVACVGQFKRGKSSLLNALVGEPLLPVGVLPVTSIVTVLRWGERRSARVRLASGESLEVDPDGLAAWVTEEQNPENRKAVAGVEVFLPSPLLRAGMCLVDTPGLGSIFARATEATREFLPHLDAALVVVGGDPPVSGDELALVEEIGQRVASLVVVLNKADRLSAVELAEAKAFAEQAIAKRLGRSVGPVLEISAAEQIAGRGPTRDWPRLESRLRALSAEGREELVEAAGRRGVERLSRRLLHELDEREGALTRPIAESERRIEVLRSCVAEAERSLADLSVLLGSEEARLGEAFARARDSFLERAVPAALSELAESLRSSEKGRGQLRGHAIALAREIFASWVERWRGEEQPRQEQLYREAVRRFAELANRFLERLASEGDRAFAELPRALPELGFRARSRLYYSPLTVLAPDSPIGWLLDRLRSRERTVRSLTRSADRYLERVLRSNAAAVTSDAEDRVRESRRELEAEIRTLLGETHRSARLALDRAREQRAAGSEAVRAELDRIAALRRQVVALEAVRA